MADTHWSTHGSACPAHCHPGASPRRPHRGRSPAGGRQPDTRRRRSGLEEGLLPGTDAGKKELAKDVCAMANTAGGMVVIGVDDGKQDHAHALDPSEPAPGRGEEWIRAVLANWVQPVVPHVGVRSVKSGNQVGKVYWLLTVPPSTQTPHAVAAPGNDYNFRVHVRHGTTTRTLAESKIAQR
ncbi:helix-turn-helix domain-containing protein, partial [Streptomyces sp. NPDC058542]|uniref:AlbA family DNA-binding domain-containing protein n=1 Tax=Streptomyces sp. NPDC058542 TaxID=3346543 RepID=UPI00365EE738